MGEYVRAATLASAVLERWPGAQVRFLLSRAAPYAASVKFATTWLESSPTFHSREVIEVLREFRPHLVVFDNAGRTAQLAAARRLGARVIFVSARRRQRARAFRLRWMRLIDEHWIAYPAQLAGELGALERLKLRLLARPHVRYLDVVMARPAAGRAAELLRSLGLEGRPFVLVVPGGGTGIRGQKGVLAAFEEAAVRLAGDGVAVLYAGGPGAAVTAATGTPASSRSEPTPPQARIQYAGGFPQADLAALLASAEVVLLNGGSTLLQAIACHAACVAAPISGDQPERIRRCAAAGLVRPAPPEPDAMARAVRDLLEQPSARAQLRARTETFALADGVRLALDAMARYIEPPGGAATDASLVRGGPACPT